MQFPVATYQAEGIHSFEFTEERLFENGKMTMGEWPEEMKEAGVSDRIICGSRQAGTEQRGTDSGSENRGYRAEGD